MSTQFQTQTKTAPVSSFTPVPSGLLQRQCACGQHTVAGGECEGCRKKREGRLHRAAVDTAPVNEVPPIVHEVLRSPGQPLNAATRTFMESRFGHDFSHVQVHNNARAADSAEAVNALAYTVGKNIVFGNGQYAPQTAIGQRLLAHELTHVVQQSLSAPSLQPQSISAPSDADEHEADALANRVLAGELGMAPNAAPSAALQRNMLNNVVSNFQPNAKACVVHLHGEERTALAVAKEIRRRRCVNLVHLDTTDRYVDFEITVGPEKHICEADPNRVFTTKGLQKRALKDKGCHLATDKTTRTDIAPPKKQASGQRQSRASCHR